MNIRVEKSEISKILSYYGAMNLKRKLRTCASQIEPEEIGFVSKKILIFSDYLLMLEVPQKYSTTNFLNFLKNKHQIWLPGTW